MSYVTYHKVAEYMSNTFHGTEDDTINKFTTTVIPPIRMVDYVYRFGHYMNDQVVVFLSALVYMHRINANTHIGEREVHRCFAACCVVAVKYWDDFVPTMLHMSKVTGIHLEELKRLEVEVCAYLDFDLHIPQTAFYRFVQHITAWE